MKYRCYPDILFKCNMLMVHYGTCGYDEGLIIAIVVLTIVSQSVEGGPVTVIVIFFRLCLFSTQELSQISTMPG